MQLVRQRLGDLVDALARLRVAQRERVRAQHGPVGVAVFKGTREQHIDQIDLIRNAQFGQRINQFGPLSGRRQSLVRKTVGMR